MLNCSEQAAAPACTPGRPGGPVAVLLQLSADYCRAVVADCGAAREVVAVLCTLRVTTQLFVLLTQGCHSRCRNRGMGSGIYQNSVLTSGATTVAKMPESC